MTRRCQLVAALLLTPFPLWLGWAVPPLPKAARVPALRWAEGQPGCTFSADDDGRYRYGLWTSDFGIVLAVDALELEKAGRRTEPIFTLLLTVRYRGKDSLSINPGAITLEFVKHAHDLHPALDRRQVPRRLRPLHQGYRMRHWQASREASYAGGYVTGEPKEHRGDADVPGFTKSANPDS